MIYTLTAAGAKTGVGIVDIVGFIPTFLSEDSSKSAAQQLDQEYVGGWCPQEGFTLNPDKSLSYAGDPDLPVLVESKFREEEVLIYDYGYVAVIQPDGSFEVCRMD